MNSGVVNLPPVVTMGDDGISFTVTWTLFICGTRGYRRLLRFREAAMLRLAMLADAILGGAS